MDDDNKKQTRRRRVTTTKATTKETTKKPATPKPRAKRKQVAKPHGPNPIAVQDAKSKNKRAGLSPEDYPLTIKERKFIDCLKNDPSNYSKAFRDAGYKHKEPNVKSFHLCRKPNVAKAIKEEIGEELLKFGVNATSMLQRAAKIAMADITEIAKFEDGRVKIVEDNELSDAGRALLQEISETVSADGSVTLKVKAKDQFNYFKLMCQYLSVLEKANQTKYKPHKEQVEALEAVMNRKKTPAEAALYLESLGVPVPDTLKLLVSRPQPEVDPFDDVPIPTAEEIWERRKAKLAAIEAQREGLPQVREEVAAIKRELGDKIEQFKPENMGE